MTDERVQQVLTDSAEMTFSLSMDLFYVATLYGLMRYSSQCPNLARYTDAQRLAFEVKGRLRQVLDRAGIIFDIHGSFANVENFQAVARMHAGMPYSLTFSSAEIMVIHGLIKIAEMYPGEIEYAAPTVREMFVFFLKRSCQDCFLRMGFSPQEVEYLDTATSEEEV